MDLKRLVSLIVLLCAASLIAQDTPVPPTATHVICDSGCGSVVGEQPVSIADGSDVTLGTTTDARSTATDATSITIMQALKEISFMEQNPASRAVTGTFWQATQPVSGTVTVTDGTGSLNVIVDSGTITTVSSVTAIANALPAGTNAIGKLAANSGVDIGDVDVTSIAAGNNNIGDVDVASVTGNVTVVQGTATNLKTQAENYQGGAAVSVSNPLFIVGTAGPISVSLPNAVSVQAAAQAFAVGAIPPTAGTLRRGFTAAMTGTTSTQVIAAIASQYLYITNCSFSNTHASVTTMQNLQDGSGGATIWPAINPFGSGNNIAFNPPLKVPTLGNALFVSNVTTGSNTFVACSGFSSAVSY